MTRKCKLKPSFCETVSCVATSDGASNGDMMKQLSCTADKRGDLECCAQVIAFVRLHDSAHSGPFDQCCMRSNHICSAGTTRWR
mmetsp:Transcript_25448/g.40980  ORF Transcript_25448/g.40980 Transcript_25448/m.40980 type:complete len:84 (+) Transcript_25448:1353-1604(+)